ncbi:MAG: hypothetical protein J6S92_05445 [Oscillospiraceae bacterium]|nr:hypothetical protein [Bacteroidaceae bacterium]MBP0987705.1 hypothetical protein [Oscillospiraceae bacterium]
MKASDIEKIIHLYDDERKAAESCRERADKEKNPDIRRIYYSTAAGHMTRAAAIENVLNVLGYIVVKINMQERASYKIVKE